MKTNATAGRSVFKHGNKDSKMLIIKCVCGGARGGGWVWGALPLRRQRSFEDDKSQGELKSQRLEEQTLI